MDWKLFATSFSLIFVAEMGDKTQLAALALAGGGSSKWTVFLGASLALIATTAIAVLLGGVVSRYVPEVWIKRTAGALFVGLGILFLLASPGDASGPGEAPIEEGS